MVDDKEVARKLFAYVPTQSCWNMECPTTDVAEAKRHAVVAKVFMVK